MQAYEGYFENGRFTPIGKAVTVHGRRRAVMTLFDEHTPPPTAEQERRVAWLKRLHKAIDLSMDEELPEFSRSTIMREPLNLKD
jgi:hypothetical protein